jgi:predicted RecB family nuclease
MLEKEMDLGLLVTRYTVGLPKGGLKQVAKYFGCGWSSKEMSGFMVGLLVSRYLSSGEEPNWEEMLHYNKEDVHATKVILEKVLQCDIRSPPVLDFGLLFSQ